jgi:hypothetical protein
MYHVSEAILIHELIPYSESVLLFLIFIHLNPKIYVIIKYAPLEGKLIIAPLVDVVEITALPLS